MVNKLDLIIKSQRVILLVMAVLCVAVIGLGNFPQWSHNKALMKEKKELEVFIEEQKLLAPPHARIQYETNSILPPEIVDQTYSAEKPENISELMQFIGHTAASSDLEIISVEPFPGSIISNGTSFKIGCEVRGQYNNLQTFLIRLGAMPTLQHVENVVTGADPNGIHCNLQLRFSIS